MNCYVHVSSAAVGLCAVCHKAVCPRCVGTDAPRVVCSSCASRRAILGFEYRSPATIGGWPLVHICAGFDPVTMRPRIAKGVVAIGNVAVGGLAVGGVACGLATMGGLSLGLLLAVGGAALGLGVSLGGLAIGSIAIGGAAIGFAHAVGGAGFGPSVIDSGRCDPDTLELVRLWLGADKLPPTCR